MAEADEESVPPSGNDLVSPRPLGPVKGAVGSRYHVPDGRVVGSRLGHAGADRDHKAARIAGMWNCELLDGTSQPSRDRNGLGGSRPANEREELLATDAIDHVVRP